MDATTFLERLKRHHFFTDQIIHTEGLPERPPTYQDVSGGLHKSVEEALNRLGIERLYSHQATAVERIREGNNVVIVTSTASGKTLCYTIPIVETLLEASQATMLCIYPTKALAQDQLRASRKTPDEGGGCARSQC